MKGVCRICNNKKDNTCFRVKERMLNSGDSFEYLECARCGTIQLNEDIPQINSYYDSRYEPHNNIIKKENRIVDRIIHHVLFSFLMCICRFERIAAIMRRFFSGYMCIAKIRPNRNARILDVGCGDGSWLNDMRRCGFRKLTGIDLFAPKNDLEGIRIISGDIFSDEIEGKYDVITFHASFEHMDNPDAILERSKELLEDNGTIMIRIPVGGCEAWKLFRENWYELDAPRHYFIYTPLSLTHICEKHGFNVNYAVFESNPNQIIYSRYYRDTDLSLYRIKEKVTRKEEQILWPIVDELNKKKMGDYASFYLSKIS